MDIPSMVTVDCPVCNERVDVTIPERSPLGTLLQAKCPHDHSFRIRIGATGVDVLTDESSA